MNSRYIVFSILTAALIGSVDANEIELLLLPVVDCYAATNQGAHTGIKVLHPRRRCVKDVIPSDFSSSVVYDTPVALLQVRNLSSQQIEIGDLLGNDWFVEIAATNVPIWTGLMHIGSCRAAWARHIRPHEILCLLIGRLRSEPIYKFRVGYVSGHLKGAGKSRETSSWPSNCKIVYSNWFLVGSNSTNSDGMGMQVEAPRLSLYRLENNLGYRAFEGVRNFSCKDDSSFVDLVVVLENDNDFPIQCQGFGTGAWKIEASGPTGRMISCKTLQESCAFDPMRYLCLKASERVAIPLFMNMSLDDYKRLDRVKIEYDSCSRHSDAELRFAEQCRDDAIKMNLSGMAAGDGDGIGQPIEL